MPIILAALALLLMGDAPRMVPVVSPDPLPWVEQGNRHARRRDKKLARSK